MSVTNTTIPVWEKPSHEEVPLHTLDPITLGLDIIFNTADDHLSNAIYDAKRAHAASTVSVPTTNFREIAMAAIARGENRVLPIEVGGKNPLIKWKDSPLDVASTEEWEGLVESWANELAQRFPNSNACVVAKPEEHIFIDCDTTREFIAGFEAWSGVKFPITYTTSARDNRTQMHFRQTDATRSLGNVQQFQIDDIDLSVRQKNLYVLSEGSQHKNRVDVYKRVVDAPIAAMPDKLVEYIQYLKATAMAKAVGVKVEGKTSSGVVGKFSGIVVTLDDNGKVPQGQIHPFMLREAGKMRSQGKEQPEIEEELLMLVHAQCVGPIDDKKVVQMSHSICNFPAGQGRELEYIPQQPDPEKVAEAVSQEAERFAAQLDDWLEFTDIQNAKLFVEDNKEFVRAQYGGVKGRTTWYFWDGARWKEDNEGRVVSLAKMTAVEQMEESISLLNNAFRTNDTEARKELTKRCKAAQQCCSDYRIHSMLNLAAGGTALSVQMTELDGQPNLINFQNGTFDTDTMELRPHRKEDLLTQLIPVNYDPNAVCPKWESFVSRVFRDKPYMLGYLSRVVGYFLAGRNPEQVFFIFYGGPGGGKTTMGRVLMALLGEYSRTCPQGLFLAGHKQSANAASPAQSDLYGARLVVSEELDEDESLDSRMVKMVTGGGKVKARPLYKPPFEYTPDYKLLFLTNHTPKVEDFSGAIDDRLRVVKMEQRLRDTDEEIQNFHDVLIKEELAGILAWAIRGLIDVKKHGLQDPPEVRLMTEKFMQSENIVQEWLEERTEQAAGDFITNTEAHHDFVIWAKGHGEDIRPMTQRWFALRMTHAGWTVEPIGKGQRVYKGLKLRPKDSNLSMSGSQPPTSGRGVDDLNRGSNPVDLDAGAAF